MGKRDTDAAFKHTSILSYSLILSP